MVDYGSRVVGKFNAPLDRKQEGLLQEVVVFIGKAFHPAKTNRFVGIVSPLQRTYGLVECCCCLLGDDQVWR